MAEPVVHSAIVENYIKNIYTLQEAEGKVSTSLLSDRLQVTPASATDMLKRLAEDDIIIHERYKGAQLTEKGARLALKIIRRHRLWELFLATVLKFEWHELHEEAESLEHSTSDALEAKLDEYLGFPTVDPHGHDIPQADGRIVVTEYDSLCDTPPGSPVTVRRVNDDSAQVLKYATELGITMNKKLRVVEKIDFDGSLRVEIDGVQQFVSEKLARCIFVEAHAGNT
jgi:DtxR family transcriptional regulator, Mn-dependent transcriptional regulator